VGEELPEHPVALLGVLRTVVAGERALRDDDHDLHGLGSHAILLGMETVEFQEAGRKVMSAIIEALSKLAGKGVPDTAAVFGLLAAAAMLSEKSMGIRSREGFLRLCGEMWDSHAKSNGTQAT